MIKDELLEKAMIDIATRIAKQLVGVPETAPLPMVFDTEKNEFTYWGGEKYPE